MGLKKSLIEITHDESYGDLLLTHINNAFWGKDMQADKIWPFVQKDEKHKRYRPFMNRAEVEPFWDKKLKFKDSNDSIFRINGIGSGGVGIGSSAYSYSEAFEQFECVDGTPFGVEVL